jgi:hypothetical protein
MKRPATSIAAASSTNLKVVADGRSSGVGASAVADSPAAAEPIITRSG